MFGGEQELVDVDERQPANPSTGSPKRIGVGPALSAQRQRHRAFREGHETITDVRLYALRGRRPLLRSSYRKKCSMPTSRWNSTHSARYGASCRNTAQIAGVMSASSIGAGKGGGYARYLEGKTVAPERGDYYLTPDGELTEAPGRWLSDPETLARLGIDPDAPVAGADFIALMEGRHPGTGSVAAPGGRRRLAGRRDRRDVQRPEVRVGRVGARGPVAARADRGRARPGGGAVDGLPEGAGAGGAPPLRRPGRRGARQGRDRDRLPPHDRQGSERR